jgi:hypothetical protein
MNVNIEGYQLVKNRLASRGIHCSDLYSLLKDKENLNQAAPLLMEFLHEVNALAVKSDIIRIASHGPIPATRFVTEMNLLAPLIEAGDSQAASLAWTVGDAIRETADDSVYQDVSEILCDKRFGKARQMLPYALVKIKSRRKQVVQLLLEVLDDTDITLQSLDALAKLKAVEAIPVIQTYLDSSNPHVKREATRVLKKLEKVTAKLAGSSAETESSDLVLVTEAPTEKELAELAEASANFDGEQVAPFLNLLSLKLDRGFGKPEIDLVDSRLLEMELDEVVTFNFRVCYAGKETPLLIEVFVDDVDAPDVAFFTSPELAATIEKLFDEVLE